MQRFVLEDHLGFEAAPILGISEARTWYMLSNVVPATRSTSGRQGDA